MRSWTCGERLHGAVRAERSACDRVAGEGVPVTQVCDDGQPPAVIRW